MGESPNMWWNGLALVNVFARNLISHVNEPFLCEVTQPWSDETKGADQDKLCDADNSKWCQVVTETTMMYSV